MPSTESENVYYKKQLQKNWYYFQDTQRVLSNSSSVDTVKGNENLRNITIYTQQIFSKLKSDLLQNEEWIRSTEKTIAKTDEKIVKEEKITETSLETVPRSYTKMYENKKIISEVKVASNSNIVPKIDQPKEVTKSKNLSKRRTENTTPVLFTNKEIESEEMHTVTTEKNKLNLLSDAVIDLLFMKSDSKLYFNQVKNIRNKRAQTYTGE